KLDVVPADGAVVMQDSAHDLAIGNDDAGAVGVQQDGAEQFNGADLAVTADNFDVFTDAKGLGKDDEQAADEIAQHALHGEADADTGNADPGDERRDVNAAGAGGDDEGEGDHAQAGDAHEQHLDGRFHVTLFKPAHHQVSGESGDHDSRR